MLSSVRQAIRALRKAPGFTLIAVLTLALGIGANTAIFSVVNALLLRGLPLEDSSRLVFLSVDNRERGLTGGAFSVADYETLRDGNRSFTGIAAFCGEGFTLLSETDPEQLPAARISPNFLDVLGVSPLLGHGFRSTDGETGARPVALISHSLWQRRFASDPHIVGKSMVLNPDVYSIAGVMPPDFAFPFAGIDVWVTRLGNYTGFRPEDIRRGAGFLTAIARLRPGVSIPRAEAEVAVLNQHYRQQNPAAPDADPHGRMTAVPLQESLVGELRDTLLLLMGAVGLLLLIACANVASLTLARATGRAREIALRTALGASRAIIVRQLLVEGSLLAGAGAAIGILLALWSVAWLPAAGAANALPAYRPIRVDFPVLVFALGVSCLTGIVFSLAPALQVSRPDLNAILRDSGWGTTGGRGGHRTRGTLVAGQMAISIVLLIGAGLLLESFRNLRAVSLGFNPHNTLTMNVAPPPAKYPAGLPRAQFFREVVQRLAAVPGVRSAAASISRPMGLRIFSPILPEGQPTVAMGQRPLAIWNAVTPGFFETYGVPLLGGRDFTWADDEKAPHVVVVSQSLARRFWPRQDALGKRITVAAFEAPFEIVGIAGDTRTRGVQADPGMVLFTPYAQWTFASMALSIRTEADPAGFAKSAAAQVRAVDKDLPVVNLQTVDALMDAQFSQPRQTLFLIGGFAAMALLLALIGLYGVMACSVAQRTTEFGIRQAIGARRGDILRLVFGQAVRLSLAGIAAGAIASVGLTRLLGGMLFHVSATDPRTYGAIAALFLAVAMLAAYIPAWRATRVDPVEALRQR